MIISRLRGKAVFQVSYFFSFFFTLFCIYWIAQVTPPGMLAAVVIVAFYYTAGLCLFNALYRRKALYGLIAVPFLWVGVEHFRTLSEFAFPWADLGYSQSYYLYILQIVSIVSVHGLSLLIVGVNVLLWQVFRSEISVEKRLTSAFMSIGTVGFLIGYGWAVMPVYPIEGNYKVAILQGSVPLELKWNAVSEAYNYNLYDSLARSVQDTSVKLFVWPETAAPCYPELEYDCRELLGKTAIATQSHHLIGALRARTFNGNRRFYNSSFQFNPNGGLERSYDKMKLVPFAEHVPYQDHFPFLTEEFLTQYLTFIETYEIQWWSDFYPGDSLRLFDLTDSRYGVLICFESAFPEFVRTMVNSGAEFIVGITNDTWFENTIGMDMHSRVFVTRAVENRTWMARAANSGYSYIVDDYGRIRHQLPQDDKAVLAEGLLLRESRSLFTRWGDVAGRFSFLLTALIAGILLVKWIFAVTFFRKKS